MGSGRWVLTPEERSQFAAQCSDGRGCNETFRDDRDWDPSDEVMWIRPRNGFERELRFWVDFFQGRSFEELEQKLRQYPTGTRIFWNDWGSDRQNSLERWTWSDRDRLFERVRRSARRTESSFGQRTFLRKTLARR